MPITKRRYLCALASAMKTSGASGSSSSAVKYRQTIIGTLQANYARQADAPLSACPADDCEGYRLMVQVFNTKPLTLELLRAFCTTDNLKIKLNADERTRGFGSVQTFRRSRLAGVQMRRGRACGPARLRRWC